MGNQIVRSDLPGEVLHEHADEGFTLSAPLVDDVQRTVVAAAHLGLEVELVTEYRLHGAGEGATGGTLGIVRGYRLRVWPRAPWPDILDLLLSRAGRLRDGSPAGPEPMATIPGFLRWIVATGEPYDPAKPGVGALLNSTIAFSEIRRVAQHHLDELEGTRRG